MRITDSSIRMASASLSYRKGRGNGSFFDQSLGEFTGKREGRAEDDNQVGIRVKKAEDGSFEGIRVKKDEDGDFAGIRVKQTGNTGSSGGIRIGRGSLGESGEKTQMSAGDEYTLRFTIFRHMIEMILYGRRRMPYAGMGNALMRGVSSLSAMETGRGGASGFAIMGNGQGGASGLWRNLASGAWSVREHQETTFESEGLVRTEDGREISFGIRFSMSRTVAERFETVAASPYILTDPLVINLSDSVTGVSDQVFHFDLDCDGKEEEIHFAGEGSGFLALDRDGDGRINDGSELFGTESGNGFGDLAGYDSDGNGWIDENDDIYERLRVWTKDSEGKDVLLSLKDADVGAIHLGSVETDFSLYSGSGYAGELSRSGIYLRESTGGARTISHVDLAFRR